MSTPRAESHDHSEQLVTADSVKAWTYSGPDEMGPRFPQGDDMSYEHQQEARRDEIGMLRWSCIGPDEHDAEYTRRDVQREKMIEDDMEQAYQEVAK